MNKIENMNDSPGFLLIHLLDMMIDELFDLIANNCFVEDENAVVELWQAFD